MAEKVSLSPEEIACLAEYQQALRDVQQQAQGALRIIMRQRGLAGNWSFQGDALVRAE